MANLQDNVQHWIALDLKNLRDNITTNLNDLFLYHSGGTTYRIQSYTLSYADFKQLLNTDETPPNNQLRVHLAATPSIERGQITDTPSFSLVLDAFNSNNSSDIPSSPHPNFHFNNVIESNAYNMTPTPGSITKNDLPPSVPNQNGSITKDQAWAMISCYQTFQPDQADDFLKLFISQKPHYENRFIHGFVVGTLDVGKIVSFLNHGDHSDLKIHLGCLPEDQLPDEDWFRFRCVLQINTTSGEANYYDFAKPCPPACQDALVENPLGS